jgi:lipopolysaccharide transport system permease protein
VRAYRYLYEQMVRRELRQKYKGSALGVLYYLINPIVLMVAYAIMTKYVLRFDAIEDYPLFLLIGIGTWLFFSQSLMASASSLIDQSSLVRKVRFPREIVPAAVVSVQFVIFAVLIALLTPITVAVRGNLDPALLLLPVLLVLLAAFALGLGLAVAVLHAYYRDVAPILGAALLPWFFLSPIFFTPGDITNREAARAALEWVNPVAPFITAVRDVVWGGVWPSAPTVLYVLAAAGLALAGGAALFRRMEAELAVVV